MNLPELGIHLGGDYWSGGGCTDLGQTVYAASEGEIVEIVDALGSFLDVVVLRHQDPQVGTVYSMYGHISREPGLAEGQLVDYRQPLGTIDDVLAYFSPCHLHFEILSEEAYMQGPFCNGCEAAGFSVSPGYDQQLGVVGGMDASGDTWIEVDDGIANNRWYHTDPFIDARLDASCESCPAIPPEGGTLDQSGPCFLAGGDPTYWNLDGSQGFEGDLLWTHTTDSEMVDNYGIWSLEFAEAGLYRLEVWIEAGTADTQLSTYQVHHAGATEQVAVNQSTGGGWIELDDFEFAQGGDQWIRLDDNTGEPFATMTRIVFDGVRLTRLDLPPGGTTGDEPEPTTGSASLDESGPAGPSDSSATGGGSSSSSTEGTRTGGPALPGGTSTDPVGCTCREGDPAPRLPTLLLVSIVGIFARRREIA